MNKLIRNILLSFLFAASISCADESKDSLIYLPGASYFPPIDGSEWESIDPDSLGWDTAALPALLTLLEDNGTRAFIVLKNGYIVIEEYFGNNYAGTAPFDMNTIWYWASAGKTLTAAVIGKAVEDGYLSIHDKTSDYLGTGWTSLDPGQEALITVRHQLTMTTGLDDAVANSHSTSPADLVYKADAGTRWAYHNGPYTLLESVFASASGLDFNDYFNTFIRDAIGMDGVWLWNGDDHVYYSTPRSMARFGLLMANHGAWNNSTILRYSAYFNDMVKTSQGLNLSYGYLWWLNGKESFMAPETQIVFPGSLVPHAPDDMFCAIGRDGQYLSIVPSENMVVVRMGEEPTSVPVPFLFLDDIWEKLSPVIRR